MLCLSQEQERVMDTFNNHLHLPVTCIDHSKPMLDRLRGLSDPEAKRKAIGAEFIEVRCWEGSMNHQICLYVCVILY